MQKLFIFEILIAHPLNNNVLVVHNERSTIMVAHRSSLKISDMKSWTFVQDRIILAVDSGLFEADKKSILGGNPWDVGWNLGRLDMWVGRWDVQNFNSPRY